MGEGEELLAEDAADALPAGAVARLGARTFRHGGQVTAVAHHPREPWIASVAQDGRLRVWHQESGVRLHDHPGVPRPFALAWGPSGDRLAVSGEAGELAVVGLGGEEHLREDLGERGGGAVLFAPGGDGLFVGARSGEVLPVDPRTGDVGAPLSRHGHRVHSLAASPDGSALASAAWDGTARIYERAGGASQELEGVRGWTGALAFSPDGERIAYGGDGALVVRSRGTGEEVHLPLEGDPVSLAISPSGRVLACVDFARRVHLVDLARGDRLRELEWDGGYLYSLSFSADGLQVASSAGPLVQRWDVGSGSSLDPGEGHRGAVRALASSGGELYSLGDDGALCRWAGARLESRRVLAPGPRGLVAAASGSDAGVWIARCDGAVELWNGEGCLRSLDGSGAEVSALASRPEVGWVVVACWDGRARILDAVDGREIGVLEGHEGPVAAAAIAPGGSAVATGAWDHGVRLFPEGEGPGRVLRGHRGPVCAVVFTNDGSRLVSGGGDGRVIVWEPASGRAVAETRLPCEWTYALAALPEGRVAAGGSDGVLRRISSRGEVEAEVRGHEGWITAFEVHQGGLVSAGTDGVVFVWGLA